MSGTPISKGLLDLYSQFKAIDPLIWDGESWTRFKQRYSVFGGFGGYQLLGYQNVEDLKRRITPYAHVLRKKDALDLPPTTHQIIPLRLEGQGWANYRQLATEKVLGEWEAKNPLELALRLQQLLGVTKLPLTVELVQDLLEADQKVVVFYRFRAEGDGLAARLSRSGKTHLWHINGSVAPSSRYPMVEAFQSLEGPGVMLLQIAAGSTAITLTAAHEVVYHSLTWAYEDYAQSLDRVYRIGQTLPVTYRYSVGVGPSGGQLIDGVILSALRQKRDVADSIMADPDILGVSDEA